MARRLSFAFVAVLWVVAPLRASAGAYSDDLGKCLVQATTREDREALVRWMFAALAAHPAVKSMVAVSSEQLEQANRTTAELFTRLLTTSCKGEAQRAMQYEGEKAVAGAFQVLGQVAARELMASPVVGANIAAFNKYVDAPRLQEVLKSPAATER